MGKWSQYGKRFSKKWEREDCLKEWVRRVPGDDGHAFCSYCKCELRAHHSDLINHMRSVKHLRNATLELEDTDTAAEVISQDQDEEVHTNDNDIKINLTLSTTSNTNSTNTDSTNSNNSISRPQHQFEYDQFNKIITHGIFVGNLPREFDEIKLERIFSKFGLIHSTWFNNSDTGSRFGLVKFYDKKNAVTAAAEINGTLIEGHKLVAKLNSKSEPKDGRAKSKHKLSPPVTEKNCINKTPSNKVKGKQSIQASSSQDNDLTILIKKLQNLSRTVKNLRIQFPLDKESPIDIAIALVLSPYKIDMNSFPSLEDTSACLSSYMTTQNDILSSPNKANLTSQIEARESIKSQLLFKLGKSINEMNSLPLQERHKQLQETITLLRKHYEVFLKLTVNVSQQMESLFDSFQAWKANHTEELYNARTYNDELEKSVNTSLDSLKSSISINPDVMEEDFEDDLLSLLNKYISALEFEISILKTENSPDCTLIASVVHVVMEKLKEELTSVDSLCKTQQQFKTLYNDIKAWIKKTPSLAPLQSLRIQLKSLKSKLRHKLADKADAEENQEMVDMILIIKELENIKSTIQKTLVEEDKFLSCHSEVLTTHFPELIKEEFAEDFKTYLTYKGLVKLSHSPDLYTLTSMSNTSWFSSQFNGDLMLIKEYFLGNANKLNKAGFLSQLTMFLTASSPYIEPIQAIFFDKDSRHAYLRIKKHGMLLNDKIENQSLSKHQCQSIVKDLSLALQTLHQSNLTHGQLNPDFVLVEDNGAASLLPPDFSMTLSERSKSKYVTKSKLEIISPEMKQNKKMEPFPAVDVYSLGLIALWLNYPNDEFSEGLGGTVNLSSISLDHNLQVFLKAALNPDPLIRPTIESCLKYKYLTVPITS